MPNDLAHHFFSLAFHWREWTELWSYEFMRAALVGSVLLSLVGGYLAVFVVLRRIVFVSVALSEFSAVGVALGLLCGAAHAALLRYSVGFGLVGVVLLALLSGGRRLTKESIVGTAYAGAAAFSILLLAVAGRHEGHELSALMWGDVLALSWHDILDLGLVVLGVAWCHALLYKEFLFCSFDPAMAATLHFRVWAFDLIFFASLGVLISFSLQVVGLLVVFAYLVVPGVIGLLAARTLRGAVLVSIGAALFASVVGLHLSWVLDLPAGLTLVAVLVALTPAAALVDRVRCSRRASRPVGQLDPAASPPPVVLPGNDPLP